MDICVIVFFCCRRRHNHNGPGDAIAGQLELVYAKQAAIMIQQGDEKFNEKLKETKDLLQGFIATEENRMNDIVKEKRRLYMELDDAKMIAVGKLRTRTEKFQKTTASHHADLERIYASISKSCKTFDQAVGQLRESAMIYPVEI
ncbi:hypothetical protein BC829DRAFT_389378 [Chytridium lagenaria]|nr:hypothetical protein BC829DRAFT_389378 [Chytridium lagenaria]